MTQGNISLVSETLLTASSNRLQSLQGIDIDGLVDGSYCYVLDEKRSCQWDPSSTASPDDENIVLPNQLTVSDSGRWIVLKSGTVNGSAVAVSSLADLPDPVGNEYILEDKTYIVSGTVDLGNRVLVGTTGTNIVGHVFTKDGFKTDSASPLFSVINHTGNISVSTCLLENASGPVLNISTTTGNFFADKLDCASSSIGFVSAIVFVLTDTSFTGFDSGLEIGDGIACTINGTTSFQQTSGATGSCIDLTGVFTASVQISASFTVIGTGIDGLASNGNLDTGAFGSIKNSSFSGTGTPIGSNLNPDDLQWIHANNINAPSSLTIGEIDFTNNVTSTPYAGANVWTKVLGTSTSPTLRRFTSPTDNRLEYIGTTDKKLFEYKVVIVAFATGTAVVEFGISLNGANPTKGFKTQLLAGIAVTQTIIGTLTLNTSDFVEVWTKNAAGVTVTVTDLEEVVSPIATGT